MATTTWTAGRLKSFITSVLRGGYRRFPPKYECLQEAFVDKRLNEKTKRVSSHYRCNACQMVFPGKDVNVDHVKPVVDPEVGFTTWDDFILNLFCEKQNLQVLCSECHTAKTKEENANRKKSNKTK